MAKQLTDHQQRQQAKADQLEREFVTRIDGRIAIIFRPRPDDEAYAEALSRIVRALESAGIT